jgi:hypothetical protein
MMKQVLKALKMMKRFGPGYAHEGGGRRKHATAGMLAIKRPDKEVHSTNSSKGLPDKENEAAA